MASQVVRVRNEVVFLASLLDPDAADASFCFGQYTRMLKFSKAKPFGDSK